jgi:aryl-alcohol dehydrogenase-like predicted oxidoreductase/histidinol phosphatase-like enzyme
MIGLGCMRLSTVTSRDAARAVSVIHAALHAGVTLLDTADAYCLDDTETGHNERLIAYALKTWHGDAGSIVVATKGGLVRPGGRWVPDGRAKHLQSACEASLRALDVSAIDLYQLHAVDSRVPLETSVRALASLQQSGLIRRIGLSNVNVGQIQAAQKIVDIASVQVSLSVLDDENLRNGVVEYCRDEGIQLIAYRPLGGNRIGRLARDPVLTEVAARHNATPHEVALAWLFALAPNIVPIPGATRETTARSIGRALVLALSEQDLAALDERFTAGRSLRQPKAHAAAPIRSDGEVVLLMGMPGAGKSSAAEEFIAQGYRRLNRDAAGGRLADLVPELDSGLAGGQRRWVLDNTYASRKSRNEVIECAARHGVAVRCIRLNTTLADAQVNAVCRLIEAHGKLPMPEELRALGKSDHRYFGPDAQFRYERQLEPPVLEEGFIAIEDRPFIRQALAGFDQKALILEYDDVLCVSAAASSVALEPGDVALPPAARDLIVSYRRDGFKCLAIAWRPQISEGRTTDAAVRACFDRTQALMETEIDFAYCPHPAGAPVCWCRKPLPGLILQFAFRHRLALNQCVFIGRSQADRTLATRVGMNFGILTESMHR